VNVARTDGRRYAYLAEKIEMQVTNEQLQAIDSGQPVVLSVEGRDCVLLPSGLYHQLRDSIEDWDIASMQGNIARMMKDDWGDAAMSVYDE
jgi:hypothetical protein